MSRELDTTVPLLGQVTTSIILISAVLGLAVGPLADRFGYRWPLVFGVLAVAVNLIGTGLAPSLPVLLGLSVVGGLGDALVFGLPLAVAGVYYSGAAQRRAIGWTVGSISGTPIIGVPILTTIGDLAGWRAALVVAGIAAAGAAWFVAVALPADERRPPARFRMRDLAAAYAPLLGHASTLRLYGATALRAVTWIGILTYLGAFLADEIGLSTRQAGLVYTVTGVGYAAGSVGAGRLLGRFPARPTVAATCAGGALTAGLAIAAAAAWSTVPLLLATSVLSSIAGIGIATLLATESPAGAGTTMVFNGSALNLGSAVGAALGGGLIALGGYGALGLGLPVFALAAAVLAGWPYGHQPDASRARP